MKGRPPDVAFHAVWLAMSVGILVAALCLRIESGTRVILPIVNSPLPETCVARTWLHLPCPGCGLTRSFISLARGDLFASWSYNPAGVYLALLVALQIPYRGLQLWRVYRGQPEVDLGAASAILLTLVPVLLLVQWLERMRSGW